MYYKDAVFSRYERACVLPQMRLETIVPNRVSGLIPTYGDMLFQRKIKE